MEPMSMRVGLDARLPERIVGTAVCLLNPHPAIRSSARVGDHLKAQLSGLRPGERHHHAEGVVTCPIIPLAYRGESGRLDDSGSIY
jgi:hypothetical protein